MKKFAHFIVLLSSVMILAGCVDGNVPANSPSEGSHAKDTIITSSVEESTITTAKTAPPSTTITTITMSQKEANLATDNISEREQIKEVSIAFYEALYSGANLMSSTSDTYINYWGKMDYSNFKRVDDVFDNILTLYEDKYGNNLKNLSKDLQDGFKNVVETYKKASLSELAKLAVNCSNSYRKLHNTVMKYSGTYKDYRNDYAVAYNNYVSDYNTFGDYIHNVNYIKKDELQPLAEIEDYKEIVDKDKENDKEVAQKVITDKIIHSDDNLVITINSIKGLNKINFTIRNISKQDLAFNGVAVAVNGCMLKTNTDFTALTSSNKIVDCIDISAVSYYGIKFIEDIDIRFFVNDENYHQLDIPICHIDLVDEKSFEYKPIGDLIYDSKKVSMYVNASGSELDDINATYYNKTDKIIDALVDETAINGVMLSWSSDNILSASSILPNCYYCTGLPDGYILLWSSQKNEIEEKGLTNIENLSGKVLVYDSTSYRTLTLDESKTITIYAK